MESHLPDRPNFYSSLHTKRSCYQVAKLYRALGWKTRRCAWYDYEVISDWAELVMEADAPILMHGAVVDVRLRVEELLAPLRGANIAFIAECYGPDRELLLELRSD